MLSYSVACWVLCSILKTSGDKIAIPTEIMGGLLLGNVEPITFYQYSAPLIFQFKPHYEQFTKLLEENRICKEKKDYCEISENTIKVWTEIITTATKRNGDLPLSMIDGRQGRYQSPLRTRYPKLFMGQHGIEATISLLQQQGYNIPTVTPSPGTIRFINSTPADLAATLAYRLLSERDHLRATLSMCQNRKLQVDFLQADDLQKHLDALQEEVDQQDLTLSLPQAASYYLLPLTECKLGLNKNLLIVHVPLLKKLPNPPSLVQIFSPSFHWQGQHCSLNIEQKQIAMINTGKEYQFYVPHCDPITDDLCFLTESYEDSHVHFQCLRRIITGGSASELASSCPMTCTKGTHVPRVKTMSVSTFLIADAPLKSTISCGSETWDMDNHGQYGILRVSLPCACHLQLTKETILKPAYPCIHNNEATPRITRLIPAAWSKLATLDIPPLVLKPPQFRNLDECLNSEWMEEAGRQQDQSDDLAGRLIERILLGISLATSTLAIGLWLYILRHQYLLPRKILVRDGPPPLSRTAAPSNPVPATITFPRRSPTQRFTQMPMRVPSNETIENVPRVRSHSTTGHDAEYEEVLSSPQTTRRPLTATTSPPSRVQMRRPLYSTP